MACMCVLLLEDDRLVPHDAKNLNAVDDVLCALLTQQPTYPAPPVAVADGVDVKSPLGKVAVCSAER